MAQLDGRHTPPGGMTRSEHTARATGMSSGRLRTFVRKLSRISHVTRITALLAEPWYGYGAMCCSLGNIL